MSCEKINPKRQTLEKGHPVLFSERNIKFGLP